LRSIHTISHSSSSSAWWKLSIALGMVDESLVLALASVLPPSLLEERRAFPVSISWIWVSVLQVKTSFTTHDAIDHALQHIQGMLDSRALRHLGPRFGMNRPREMDKKALSSLSFLFKYISFCAGLRPRMLPVFRAFPKAAKLRCRQGVCAAVTLPWRYWEV
jgi:hypothetical protein